MLPGLGSLVDFLGNQIQPILAAVAAAILTLIVPAIATLVASFSLWATAAWATATATLTAMAPLLLMAGAIALAVGVLVAAWRSKQESDLIRDRFFPARPRPAMPYPAATCLATPGR